MVLIKRHYSLHLRKRIASVCQRISQSSNSSSINVGGMGLRSRSQENLKKLSDCMDNMDEDVTNLFMEYNQTDFREDPELLLLLSDYFATSKGVSELCESLRKSLETAEHKECYFIDKALRDFQEEKLGYHDDGLLEASFRKTLQDLRNFSDCDCDFISGELLKKTQKFHDDLANMIVKLEEIMKKIDKKLRRVRGLRAIIAAAVLASAIAVMTFTKFFGSIPTEALAKFAALKWRKSTEALKREKTAMTSMERGTLVALKEIEKISKLVIRLEKAEKSIRGRAESAVKKESTVAEAMGGMEKEGKTLKSMLVDLNKETQRCDDFAKFGRTIARDRIVQFLSRGSTSK